MKPNEAELGKVYFSKKLQQPVTLVRIDGRLVWLGPDIDGNLATWTSAHLGPDLDPMVRGVHYEAAMGAAENLTKLCHKILDRLEQGKV